MPRHLLLALTIAACVLLAVAEFTDLYSIRTEGLGEVLKTGSAGGHHGYALLIVGVFAAVMAVGAWRGSRPAAYAVAALGLAALLIVLIGDAPDLDETGKLGEEYEARAQGEIGFKLETAGAILLLFAGVITSVLQPTAGGSRPDSRRRPGRRRGDSAPARPSPEDTAGGEQTAR